MAFRGTILPLPIGLQGFNGSKNPSRLGPGHFSFVEGVDLDGDVLIKDGGALKINASALAAAIIAGFNWSPVPGEYDDVVVLSSGVVRKDTGAGTFPTNMGSITAPTVFPPFFCVGGGEAVGQARKLFIFSESTQVKVAVGTGATIASITNPAADWSAAFPIFGVLHDSRMWAGGNASDPHRIYYSTGTSHQDFTSAGSGTISVFPGEGEQLVGGMSYKGILILWKYPRGIYLIDTSDPDITKWKATRLTRAVGTVSPWTIVQIGNDILYLMNDGTFHLMSTTNDFGDFNTSNISHAPNYFDVFMRANVSLTDLRKAMGAWYAAKSKAWFVVRQAGATHNNLRIMIDFNNPQAGARFLLSRRDEADALWMRPDTTLVERPTIGDSAGFAWQMDQEARDKDGAAFTMEFETSENDFGFADPNFAPRTKNGEYLEVVADLVNNETNIAISPAWDGLETDGIVMSLGGAGAALGSFVMDADALAATGIVTAKARLTGQGRRLRLSISNDDLDAEVRLAEVRVGFTVADERLRNG